MTLHLAPCIYVVATPIGNIDDCSPRARTILAEVDLIAAEDTRRAQTLLKQLGIPPKKTLSYFDAVEAKKALPLVQKLQDEQLSLALISDAGTPCVADPGYRLIKLAHEHGVRVIPVPGPSSLTALVSASGLPSHRFTFVGFLPTKKEALSQELQSWQALYPSSIICYESARRLVSSLKLLAESYPQAQIAIGRELTKTYEEIQTLSIAEACNWAQEHKTLKGELVLMVDIGEGAKTEESNKIADLLRRARLCAEKGLSHRDLLDIFANEGLEKKVLYNTLLTLKHPVSEDF